MLASLVAMWGSSFVFIKIAVAVFSPQSLVATRLALATLLLGAVMLLTGRRFPSEGRQWRYFAVMAIVGNAMPFWLISWGQQEIESGLAEIELLEIVQIVAIFNATNRLNAGLGIKVDSGAFDAFRSS